MQNSGQPGVEVLQAFDSKLLIDIAHATLDLSTKMLSDDPVKPKTQCYLRNNPQKVFHGVMDDPPRHRTDPQCFPSPHPPEGVWRTALQGIKSHLGVSPPDSGLEAVG